MLKEKVAVVTGASRGIGRAIALGMAENGANVAIIYAGNKAAAEETRETAMKFGVKAEIYCCDVSDFEATKELTKKIIEDFGHIDILVNNAGITKDALVLTMSEADFDAVINTNLKGVFNMIKNVYSPFMKQRHGKIINISSVSGLSGNAGQANYSAAKAGIVGLTKTVAKELAGRNVNVNAIAPGFIETDMTDKLSDKIKEGVKDVIPMKKMGKPEDIANMAVFLASDKANYITGEIIRVDGGIAM
ncbi:MAG: 3-oxoacyl-[acyl-carrier-protein] reductase [Clostridia bacterium]|nr:3-oxoacyl-[acyl-carrier-protein] reductase [Clostridia bacterium]